MLRKMKYISMFIVILMIVFTTAACSSLTGSMNPAPESAGTQGESRQEPEVIQTEAGETAESEQPAEVKEPIQAPEPADQKKAMIGIWHASPAMGAGWNDNFHFFEDGTFKLDYSEFDEEKRVVNMSGTWDLSDGKLLLLVTKKTIVEGGELAEPSPSATSEHSIVDGEILETDINPPETVIYDIGSITEDSSYPHPTTCEIGGKRYWKFYDDPNID